MQIIISKQLNKSTHHPLRPMPVSVSCKGSRRAGEAQRNGFCEGRFWSGFFWWEQTTWLEGQYSSQAGELGTRGDEVGKWRSSGEERLR